METRRKMKAYDDRERERGRKKTLSNVMYKKK